MKAHTTSVFQSFYPLLLMAAKVFGIKAGVYRNRYKSVPNTSFYNLKISLNNGSTISCNDWKGKKILIVNIASGCGYTRQLGELENLQQMHQDRLIVVGFPSNDFKEQEQLTDKEIAAFCSKNFGVTFLIAKKSRVIKGTGQNEVYEWLTNTAQNGWNDNEPEWNFSKYLIDERGSLTCIYGAGISPVNEKVIKAVAENG